MTDRGNRGSQGQPSRPSQQGGPLPGNESNAEPSPPPSPPEAARDIEANLERQNAHERRTQQGFDEVETMQTGVKYLGGEWKKGEAGRLEQKKRVAASRSALLKANTILGDPNDPPYFPGGGWNDNGRYLDDSCPPPRQKRTSLSDPVPVRESARQTSLSSVPEYNDLFRRVPKEQWYDGSL